jgi:hypothetical protein
MMDQPTGSVARTDFDYQSEGTSAVTLSDFGKPTGYNRGPGDNDQSWLFELDGG